MQDITLIGASGTSYDIIEAIEDINAIAPRFYIRGILDDDPGKQGGSYAGQPIIGTLADAAHLPGQFILGIASSKNRQLRGALVARLGLGSERYASVIHPSAQISRRAEIGPGTVVLHQVVIGPEVVIGAHVVICAQTTVGHNSRIGAYTAIAPAVGLSGAVTVGEGAYLGSGVRVRENVRIGDHALVGIGSVVLSNIAAGITVLGNPARQFLTAR